MNAPEPVYLGQFQPMMHGDVLDRFIDIAADLVESEAETITAAAFSVTAEGDTTEILGVVAANSVTIGTGEDAGRVDFQISVPATAGAYTLAAVFTISDGQRITKTASLEVV